MNSARDEVAMTNLSGDKSPFGQRPFISFQTWEELMNAVSESFKAKGLPTATGEWLLSSFGNFVANKGSPEEQAHWHSILATKPHCASTTERNRTAKFSSIKLQPQATNPQCSSHPEPTQPQEILSTHTKQDGHSQALQSMAQTASQQSQSESTTLPQPETSSNAKVEAPELDYTSPFCEDVGVAYRIGEKPKGEPSAPVPQRLLRRKKRTLETEQSEGAKKNEPVVKKRKVVPPEQAKSESNDVETQATDTTKSLQQEKEEPAAERLKLKEENEAELKRIQDEKANLEKQRRELQKDQIKWELEKTLLMGMRSERESWLKEKEAGEKMLKEEKAKWAEEKERLIAFLGAEMAKCLKEQEVAFKAMKKEVEEMRKEKELFLSSLHREKLQLLQTLQERKRHLAVLEEALND